MKATADYPKPTPITWTLTLDDDEMAALVVAVTDSPNTKFNIGTYARLSGAVSASWERLLDRGRELEALAREKS